MPKKGNATVAQMKRLLKRAEPYKVLIFLLVSVVGFAWWLKDIQADASEAKQAVQQQADINAKLTALITAQDKGLTEVNTKLQVYLELYGVDKDKAAAFAIMPRQPQVDKDGRIVLGVPWLLVDSTLQVGIICRAKKHPTAADSVVIEQAELWNFLREKK